MDGLELFVRGISRAMISVDEDLEGGRRTVSDGAGDR